MNRCWHLLGLPPDRLARATVVKQIKEAGDANFTSPRVAAINDPDLPREYEDLHDEDVMDIATEMRELDQQFSAAPHPGYDSKPITSAIDYFDFISSSLPNNHSVFTPTVSAISMTVASIPSSSTSSSTSDDYMPDFWWPDDSASHTAANAIVCIFDTLDSASFDSLPNLLPRPLESASLSSSNDYSLPALYWPRESPSPIGAALLATSLDAFELASVDLPSSFYWTSRRPEPLPTSSAPFPFVNADDVLHPSLDLPHPSTTRPLDLPNFLASELWPSL